MLLRGFPAMHGVLLFWVVASWLLVLTRCESPWLTGFEGQFPSDMMFVKGKKVAGTTLCAILRAYAQTHNYTILDTFSFKALKGVRRAAYAR